MARHARFDYDRSVVDDMPDIASIAGLVGDPTRARMLTALMGGVALSATELAIEADIVPSTASSHLRKLQLAGLLSVERQGRHRYFRLAGPQIAEVFEGLMGLAATRGPHVPTGPRDLALRTARVCYDHLAGEMAVRLLANLRTRGIIVGEKTLSLSDAGRTFFGRLGIDAEASPRTRRPLCRPCLDWSERRPHLAGALGAEVLRYIYKQRWARRDVAGRALRFSTRGQRLFERVLLAASG